MYAHYIYQIHCVILCVEKMRESFVIEKCENLLQCDSHIFQHKNKSICYIFVQDFNEKLINAGINFEQLAPDF